MELVISEVFKRSAGTINLLSSANVLLKYRNTGLSFPNILYMLIERL